jgi:hypothetical protein
MWQHRMSTINCRNRNNYRCTRCSGPLAHPTKKQKRSRQKLRHSQQKLSHSLALIAFLKAQPRLAPPSPDFQRSSKLISMILYHDIISIFGDF